jgi:hypothetical protein
LTGTDLRSEKESPKIQSPKKAKFKKAQKSKR